MRLIDADALKKRLLEKGFYPAIVKRAIEDATVVDAKREIAEMPAADVAPVVHGRWKKMGEFAACSECGCSPAFWEPKPRNPQGYPDWCYGCGAKMDGGTDDEA